MAKSYREISEKKEKLIEQGDETDRKVKNCQAGVASAATQVAIAQRKIAAASKTDANGKPAGDVDSARAELHMAEMQLTLHQRELESAKREAENVKREKSAVVHEAEIYTQIEQSNLDKVLKLRSMVFGENASKPAEGIAQRMNEVEKARVELLHSMGIEATPNYVTVEGSGAPVPEWKGGGVSGIDTSGEARSYQGGGSEGFIPGGGVSAPVGGGLGTYNHSLNDENMTRYTSHEDLSEEVDYYASDYQAHFDEYNSVMRADQTNDRIEKFRSIINSHIIHDDVVLYRRATLDDLGKELANIPIDQLVNQCYSFKGIMSTGKREMAERFSGSNSVLFEIKVPAGTPGLDLTQVACYQEAMFDSPYCLIESVGKIGFNTTHIVVRILSSGEGINRVNSYQSLKDYMNKRYSVQLDDSIKELNFDTVKRSISGLESVVREYPEVGVHLEKGITSKSGVMSCSGSKVSFNPDYFSDKKRLILTCTNMSRQGFWIKNASPLSIGAHEGAHGVEWSLICANSQYTSEADRIKAWNNCTEASRIVREACSNIKNSEYGKGKNSTELVRAISKYALQNDSETMAEAFADALANGDNANPLSKEIKRITRLFMNKYKGGS